MKVCKHLYWARVVYPDLQAVTVRWCARCGAIFHKVRLNNGQWSLRSRWIRPILEAKRETNAKYGRFGK